MDLKIFMLDLMHVVNLTFSEQNYHSNMLESVYCLKIRVSHS